MTYIESGHVKRVLSVLSHFDGDWLLLRNTQNELPFTLEVGKDIDLLLRYSDRESMLAFLNENKFKMISHPLRNDVKLYGVHQFEMLESQDGVLVDIDYEIAVRSSDEGQWIPLDQEIQKSAFENKQLVDIAGFSIPMLSDEDLFVSELSRQVFVKKRFTPWHQQFLAKLYPSLSNASLLRKLGLVFFSYSNRLLEKVEKNEYDDILHDYLSYSDY